MNHQGSTAIMNEVTSAIESLRRETRHDLRDLRAAIQGLTEIFTENSKCVVKLEGEIALMEQKCESFHQKLAILQGEVTVLEEDVKKLKAEKQRLLGSWQAIVSMAVIASAISGMVVRYLG